MERDAESYALVCVLSVLSVLGVAGNLVVLYVFSRPVRRDRPGATAVCPSASATVYIMALAVADLVTCSLDIPSTIYMEWVEFQTRCNVFCKFYQVMMCQPYTFSNSLSVKWRLVSFLINEVAYDHL